MLLPTVQHVRLPSCRPVAVRCRRLKIAAAAITSATSTPAPRVIHSTGPGVPTTAQWAAKLGLTTARVGQLIGQGIAYKPTIKMGRAGVCQKLASQIDLRLRNVEVVKLEAGKDRQHNMKQIRQQLEEIMPVHVLWIAGAKAVIYRGPDYIKQDLPKPIIKVTHEELENEFEPAQPGSNDQAEAHQPGESR